MSTTINGTSGVTYPDGTNQTTSPFTGGLGFRNRIINGDFRIDQRNAGASVTPINTQFITDRFRCQVSQASKYSAQQSSVAPAGFVNSLLLTSLSAYSVTSSDFFDFRQSIEGTNIADLAWGTANAAPITLSFWVRSSLTGTFGGALKNGDSTRSYPFSYVIASANTWEQKVITIAGDTSGTWYTTNSIGIQVIWGIGVGSTYSGTAGTWASANYLSATGATSVVGTNGATFYITGVQLEKGSTATSFDYRPYGTELALCQRYYYRSNSSGAGVRQGTGYATSSNAVVNMQFPTTMRTNPTALDQSGTAGDYGVAIPGSFVTCTAVPVFVGATTDCASVQLTATGLTSGYCVQSRAINTNSYFGWSAEL